MTRPCTKQQRQIDHLVSLVRRARRGLPSTLLLGPSGAGKRTIARLAAEELGLDFIEVMLAGPPQSVKGMLFGTREQAEQAYLDGLPPGYLGEIRPHTLLYLVGIEQLVSDPDRLGNLGSERDEGNLTSLLHSIQGLVSRRSYSDQLRSTWALDDDIWIVGALKSPMQTSATDSALTIYESWLSTAFQIRFEIEPPTDSGSLFQICVSIGAQFGVVVDPNAKQFFSTLPPLDDNLRACRRWVERAATTITQGEQLTEAHLHQALLQDLQSLLANVSYRAEPITVDRVQAWIQQFPRDLHGLAASLVRWIAREYYVSPRRFHEALEHLWRDSGIKPRDSVIFCRWQNMGDSAPKLASALKSQAGWRSGGEVDLNRLDGWDGLADLSPRWFILADDFVGSGGTVSRLFAETDQGSPLPRLLDRFPEAQARILVIAGFENGLRQVRAAIPPQYRDRVRLVSHILWGDEDRCFSPTSRIIPNADQREQLKHFCVLTGRTDMRPLPKSFWLGYGDSGALVVFQDAVPNNSLPILWSIGQTWQPLFPRHGLPK